MQAIARVNRTCGKDKTCGYVVDYVGITQHLKEALSEYASLEGVSEEDKDPMQSVAEDIDRLNSAYNEILSFVRDEVCYDISNFAWRLVMCPQSVIDYVVVHELSHITYKDHSAKFWTRVATIMPNYKEAQDWLRLNRKLMEVI